MLEFLHHFFGLLCGQNPDHTWALGGDLLPCCQRCLGIYVGAAVATMLHATLKPRLTARFLAAHGLFLLLMVPFGLYWIPQGPALRSASGVLFGFAVTTFLRSPFQRTSQPLVGVPHYNQLTARRGLSLYSAGLAVTVCALPLIATRVGHFAAIGLSTIAFFGALALGALVLAGTGLVALAGFSWMRRRSAGRSCSALIRTTGI